MVIAFVETFAPLLVVHVCVCVCVLLLKATVLVANLQLH